MTVGQGIRTIIIWVTAWLMFDIMSVPVHDLKTQFWLGIAFVVVVACNSGYALWILHRNEGPRHPSAVAARIREGIRRGREEAKER